MPGMMQALQRIFGGRESGEAELLPPEARIEHIEQNIRALTSIIDQDRTLTLDTPLNGELQGVEILADRIHLTRRDHDETVSLDDYNALEEEVRCQLARKIARLLPGLSQADKAVALEHTIRVLKLLAQDQSERVRQMVAEELKDLPGAPYDVVQTLAWDTSLKVSCPILEFSPLLRDEDLIDIISGSGIPGMVEAIARRKQLSGPVGEAIVETHQPLAIEHLLNNSQAELSPRALEVIVQDAPQHPAWHAGLMQRPELTQSTVNRIASFISRELILRLEAEGKINRRHKQDTAIAVTHRLRSWTADQERQAELRARDYHAMGRLDEEMISDAIAEVNEPFVAAALALRSGMRTDTAKRILRSQSGSAITALAWKAGLSMRTAMALQMKIGRVHHTKMLNARGGTDYPITEFEMQTYLEIFTG